MALYSRREQPVSLSERHSATQPLEGVGPVSRDKQSNTRIVEQYLQGALTVT